MKLVSDVLEGMSGIHIFYVVGLLIFIGLFLVIVVQTYRRPKSEMIEIKTSILSDDAPEEPETTKS